MPLENPFASFENPFGMRAGSQPPPIPGGRPAQSQGGKIQLPGLGDIYSQFLTETGQLQGAADRMHSNLGQVSGQFGQTLKGIGPAMKGAFGYAAGLLGDLESELRGGKVGKMDLAGFDARAGGIMGDLDQRLSGVSQTLKEGYAQYDAAVETARNAAANYGKGAMQDMAGMIAGVHSQLQTTMSQIKAGLRPDGSMMTPEEQDNAFAQVKGQVEPMVAQTYATMSMHVRDTQAQLDSQVASYQTQAGGARLAGARTELEGASLRSGTATNLSAQRNAMEGQNAAQDIAITQIRQANRQMMGHWVTTGLTTALQYELNGQQALADMIRSNPESVVSMLSGMTSIYGLSQLAPKPPMVSGPMGGHRPLKQGMDPRTGLWTGGRGDWSPGIGMQGMGQIH
jgi:hypothetical protein